MTEEQLHHVVTIENLEGLKRKVNVTIDIDGVKLAMAQATESVLQKIQLKGFRKGKAPKQLVEKMCPDEIKNMTTFMLTQASFNRACQEQNLTPLTEPKVQMAVIGLDGSFNCEFLLEVKPSIVPTGYIGMSLKSEKVDLNSAISQRVSDLQEHHIVREVRKQIEENFEVTLDFWVLIDGKKINEGIDRVFVIKKGQAPPFGENLLGCNMGDMCSVDIVLPESYKENSGKTAQVKMDIKLVSEKIKPSIKELVEKMKAPSYEELYDVIKKDVENSLNNQKRAALEEQVVDRLIELHEFAVPETWVLDEEKYIYNQLNMSKIDDNMKNMVHNMAERNVRRTFLIESIYESEQGLKLKEEDVEEFIKMEATRLNISTLVLKDELKKKNMVDGVITLLKNNKVMNYILAAAQIEECECKEGCECQGHTCETCSCEKE